MVPPSDSIDWAELDVCTVLDEATVQAITGVSDVGFVSQGGVQAANGGTCFWGANKVNVPAYVEIGVWRNDGTMPVFSGGVTGQACSESAVAGVGTDARGGTCPPPPQRKVYLVAIEQGVAVTVKVNEPRRALDPDDLAAYVNMVLQNLR